MGESTGTALAEQVSAQYDAAVALLRLHIVPMSFAHLIWQHSRTYLPILQTGRRQSTTARKLTTV